MIKGHGSCTITHLEKELREIDMLALPWLCALGCIRMGFTHPHKLNMKLIISGVPCNLLQKQLQDLLWIIIAGSTSMGQLMKTSDLLTTVKAQWNSEGAVAGQTNAMLPQDSLWLTVVGEQQTTKLPHTSICSPHIYVSSDKCLPALKLDINCPCNHRLTT